VKLKVTNSMGSDSMSRTNVFRVIATALTSFNTLNPVNNTRKITSPDDTGKVLFNWIRSSTDTSADYKINFRKPQSGAEKYFYSTGNGRDTFSLLSKGFLDSMAVQFGLTGDSVIIIYRAKVYNGTDSLATTNTAILVLRRGTVGIQTVSTVIPGSYRLYQNYPNLFNPSTNIEFDLPEAGETVVKLFDITGKEVSELLNRRLDAGKYKYTFNGSHLNSGVYFVRLTSNEFSAVSKIVMVK